MNTRTQSLGKMSQPSRIAALLGFENAGEMDEVALADRVAAGLEAEAATSLNSALEPVVDVVGGIIPEATFHRVRRDRKPLSREISERLYEVGRVLEVARQSYSGDDAAAKAFLTRAHPLLDGRTPLDLAQRSAAGADAVVNLLRRAEAGFSV